MTFTGTLANINAALNGLTYNHHQQLQRRQRYADRQHERPGNTGGGGPQTATSTVGITVNHVNQPPVNTVPGPQSTNQNTALVFSSANGNAITVADSDSRRQPRAGDPQRATTARSAWRDHGPELHTAPGRATRA